MLVQPWRLWFLKHEVSLLTGIFQDYKELRLRGLRTGSAVSSVLSGRREKAALNDRNSVHGDSRCHSPH